MWLHEFTSKQRHHYKHKGAVLVEPRLEELISSEQIAERVAQMGQEIRTWYGDETVLVIGVLKGSFVFLADLIRAISGDVECAFLGVSSYVGTRSTGDVRITHDLSAEIRGRHVLLVEDIVDTGLTLDYIRSTLSVRGPASLRVVSLLDKPMKRQVQVDVEMVGFSIPDEFVIGYGLDFNQRYRNLSYVAIYRG